MNKDSFNHMRFQRHTQPNTSILSNSYDISSSDYILVLCQKGTNACPPKKQKLLYSVKSLHHFTSVPTFNQTISTG